MSTMMLTIMSKTHSFPHVGRTQTRRRRRGGGGRCSRRRRSEARHDDDRKNISSSSSSSSSSPQCVLLCRRFDDIYIQFFCGDKIMDTKIGGGFLLEGIFHTWKNFAQTRTIAAKSFKKQELVLLLLYFRVWAYRGHYLSIHRSALLPLSTVRFSIPCFSESSNSPNLRTAATTLRIYPSIPSSPLSRASRPRRNTSSLCSPTRILFRLARRRRAR